MALQMVVVQHPKLEKVKYTVPAADEARWVKQGWQKTDDEPQSVPLSGDETDDNLNTAQKAALGLVATAGEERPAPTKPKTTKPVEAKTE